MDSRESMSRTFEYDVFLSHNQADKPWVRRLVERLQAAGLRVLFYEWIIQPVDDIFLGVEHGLEAARTLVLCLSCSVRIVLGRARVQYCTVPRSVQCRTLLHQSSLRGFMEG